MKTEKSSPKKSFVRRINLVPRLVCLAIAFMIWIYVMEVDSPDYETDFSSIPITVVGTTALEEKGLSVFSGADSTVDITVKGQKSVISRYTKDDINVTVDVTDVTESGRTSFELFFDLPSGLSLSQKSASNVSLLIDKRAVIDVSVMPRLSSYKIATDYELGQITCDTTTLSVAGPASVVSDISYASVDVNLGDNYITESWVTDAAVVLMNLQDEAVDTRYLKLSQNSVKVNVPVFSYKTVELKAAYKYGYFDKDGTEVAFEPKTVRVKGDPQRLADIDNIVVTTLDEKLITRDTSMLVDIICPDGLTLADGEPTVSTVNITRHGVSRRSMRVRNIDIDTDKDIKCEVITGSVAVTIVAPDDKIMDISESDITLYADLTNFKGSEGTVSVPVDVRINYDEAVVYELGEYTVQVKITK